MNTKSAARGSKRGFCPSIPLRLQARTLIQQVGRGVQQAERGEGDVFAMTQYTAWLWFILMIGVVIGMAGIWRIGANYANDYSTRNGAVTTADANTIRAEQADLFQGITGGDLLGDDNQNTLYQPALGSRTSLNAIYTESDLSGGVYIGAQSRVRLERFYPGKEICDAFGNCRE